MMKGNLKQSNCLLECLAFDISKAKLFVLSILYFKIISYIVGLNNMITYKYLL